MGEILGCEAVALDVAAYFDGEAGAAQALRARRHLDSCSSCALMWRDWGDVRLLLRSARLPAPPSNWPAALVQRARLQALLPALFAAPAGPANALGDLGGESGAGGDAGDRARDISPRAPRAPRELRQAILSRTTRAASAELFPNGSSGASVKPRADGTSHGSQKWTVRALAVPSLAAWMLVLASTLSPESAPPTEVESAPDEARSVLALAPDAAGAEGTRGTRGTASTRDGATVRAPQAPRAPATLPQSAPSRPGPAVTAAPLVAPLVASRGNTPAAPAKSPASRDQNQARPAIVGLPHASLGAVGEGHNAPAPSTAALVVTPRAERLAQARVPGAVVPRVAAPEAARASTPAGETKAQNRLADASPASGQNEPRVRVQAVSGGALDVRAGYNGGQDEAIEEAADDESGLFEDAQSQDESLSVSREMNDARPTEIGQALDDYAASFEEPHTSSP